ncbi:hypothetical protein GALL_31440 [mine drainage metagenome]|uniref:Uncharacterized protein n=1 Tax=mine drainage metagenome TaxID=410659 RepID=A0A1J5T8H9_9ZZZZ
MKNSCKLRLVGLPMLGREMLENSGLKRGYNVSRGFEGELDDSRHRNSPQ